MRHIRYIAAFVTLIFATACTIQDLDDTTIDLAGNKDKLQIVGRVTQFTDRDVVTRSKKDGDEPKVTSMGLALFPINDGALGNCIYYDYKEGGSIVFVVDRHDAVFDTHVNKLFAMYIFANMHGCDDFPTRPIDGTEGLEGIGKSLEYFTTCAVNATQNIEDVPDNGFPMMGSLGDHVSLTDGDGGTLILKPTADANNVDGLPIVGDNPTDNLEIPLKAMYAKFTFTISVKPDQEIVGNKAPRFDVTGYTVQNIAKTVDSNSATNNDAEVITTSGEIGMSSYAQGATTAKFDFYIPERYLSTTKKIDDVLPTNLKKGTYDSIVDTDQNGYRDEDERYHQRYKNKLPGVNQNATFVTINGKYTDHQGHVYDVDYNIYLGGNNYDDFNIIRNTHYDNSVTIRGISASDDQATDEEAISIDWRVNVNRSTPLVIGLRRESLLDAHFEVRPLRMRLVGENIPQGTSATVRILNEDGSDNNIPSWIRLEKSGTGSDYITTGVSAGKRKYFTTNLVTETLAASGTSVTLNNLNGSNQAIWIYVDENTETKPRTAIVSITYDGNEPENFKIVQNGLYQVENEGRSYYIEQYEEYLYNYDAEDSYGQTKYEGMPWGLNGVQLSNKYFSFDPDLTANVDWDRYETKSPRPYYDFYIKKHDDFAENNGGKVREYPGQEFTDEIAKNSKAGIKYLTMAETPSSAVEYCYNRNRRNSDGSIAKVEWYLPAADELEDIIVVGFNTFEEFQDNYYWTSQPAYIRNIFYYESSSWGSKTIASPTVYDDNTEYARATKVVRNDGEFEYAKSGLNTEPTPYINRTQSGYTNLGYFYVMHYWKGNNDYGPVKAGTQTGGDERYTYGNSRYYIHLGFLDSMMQDGYQMRTKSNRVRCAYKKAN